VFQSVEQDRKVATEWMSAELTRVWLIGERTLRQFQAARLRFQPDHPQIKETEEQLTRNRVARGGAADKLSTDAELAELVKTADAKAKELRAQAPIGAIAQALRLGPLELETLVFALSPHLDPGLADLFAIIRGTPNIRRGVDLALVALLLRMGRTQRVQLIDCLDPERPLLAWRLIQVAGDDAAGGTSDYSSSTAARAIQPTLDLLSVLLGRSELPPALARSARTVRGASTLDGLVLDDKFRPSVERLLERAKDSAAAKAFDDLPWMIFWGPEGCGKLELATRVAAAAGRPVLAFDPAGVDKTALRDSLARTQREALIRGAILHIGPIVDPLGEELRIITQALLEYPSVVTFGVRGVTAPILRGLHARATQELQIPIPAERSRLALWERLPAAERGEDLELVSFARSFAMTPGEIEDVVRDARAVASSSGRKVDHAGVRLGIDRRMRNELGNHARRIEITATWDDMILNEDEMDRVREFIGRKLHHTKVYEDWGYGERISYGKGMIALFSGLPGTGKTMLAGLIARALDLDLYSVDLSQIISKWAGETEKAIGKVFDRAERAHAVLLFDEADSLFGKRTNTGTSQDRYGNMAVNYLLQRMESYTGVAILTTNKDAAIDDAVQRRLALHLRFDMPEADERARLWRSFLLPSAPKLEPIDVEELADEFELTGGFIKNAAVRAAFLAAARSSKITMDLLQHAAVLEMEDMGRVMARRAMTISEDEAALESEEQRPL
jgi:AAA+ superfamily predicted ATPase